MEEVRLSRKDRDWIESKCGKVERTGLYFMVFMIFLSSCDDGGVKIRHNDDATFSIECSEEEAS